MVKLKNLGKRIIVVVGAILLVFSLSASVKALEVFNLNGDNNDNSKIIQSQDTIDDNLAIFAQDIEIKGTVNGDVLAIGNQVSVSGNINGSLIILSGSIADLGGEIEGNLFILSPKAQIGGKVGRDAFVVAETLKMTTTTLVNGDVFASVSESTGLDDASINGKTVVRTPPLKTNYRLLAVRLLSSMLSLLFVGLLVLRFSPRTLKSSARLVFERWGGSLLAGIIGLIFTPIVVAILFSSAVTMPIGLVLVAFWLAQIYLAIVAVAYFIGKTLSKGRFGEYWSMIIGVALISVLFQVPTLGGLLWVITLAVGFGALFLAQKEIYQKIKKANII